MSKNEIRDDIHIVPEAIKKMQSSTMDRRSFLVKMAMAGAATAIPFYACKNEEERKLLLQRDPAFLSKKEWEILHAVLDLLFPSELDSPGAKEINAAAYIQWVIKDEHVDPERRKFLKDGLTWVDEEAMERWDTAFLQMIPENRQKLLRHMEDAHSWGKSWISAMLLRVFEALFADPVYGTNPDGKNWQWLNYTAGQPRPKVIYSEALK